MFYSLENFVIYTPTFVFTIMYSSLEFIVPQVEYAFLFEWENVDSDKKKSVRKKYVWFYFLSSRFIMAVCLSKKKNATFVNELEILFVIQACDLL